MEMKLTLITSLAALSPLALSLLAGCAGNSQELPSTRPALSSIPAERGTADYWLNQPAVASVSSVDYQRLWAACGQTLRDDQFEIEQEDYREGVLTTWPMVSMQFFEFWRSDAGTLHGVMLDSLQTIRRSVRFESVPQAGWFVRGASEGTDRAIVASGATALLGLAVRRRVHGDGRSPDAH